jgi:Cytochrome C oxidase subunit II, periplasmic domain
MKILEYIFNLLQNFFDLASEKVAETFADLVGVDLTGNSPWLNEPASFSSEAMGDLHGHVMLLLVGVISVCLSLTMCAIFPFILFEKESGVQTSGNVPITIYDSVNRFLDRHKELFNRLPHGLIEILITLFPMFVTCFIVVPALHLLYITEEFETPVITVKVTAHQWYWTYEIEDPDSDSFLVSDYDVEPQAHLRLMSTQVHPVFPINVPIRFLVTSTDVLHSWSIPSLGIKVDAVPGRLNQVIVTVNRPGTYYGQCSELCGAAHGFMPIEVKFIDMTGPAPAKK